MSHRRSAPSAILATAPAGMETVASPTRLKLSGDVVGQAGSPQALARLNVALREMKALAATPLLQKAAAAINRQDHKLAAELALKALQTDETNGFGWYLLAMSREAAGDFRSALQAYEAALKLIPTHVELANDLGRLASRLGMNEVAEKLFRVFLAAHPENIEAYNNLACVLRDQNRYGEAVDVLTIGIEKSPLSANLWNTLATVLSERGDVAESMVFFDESCRLDPGMLKARYNRGNARLAMGDCDGALADCEAALQGPMQGHERAMMRLARATIHVARGELAEGWDGYEERLSPDYIDVTHFAIDRPQWTPEDDLEGKSLLLMGEQGLGDEVLFANIIPDIIEALGPKGRLSLGLQPRLIPLFQRSFPEADIGRHTTLKVDAQTVRGAPFLKDLPPVDLWAPMASPLRRFRRSVEAFPDRARFLIPDESRVAHWRKTLEAAGPGPKVGLVWKSMRLEGARMRHYSPFEQWRPILEVPGVAFVNLQYGECAEEIEQAREALGVEIWQPPGIDLKDDLDDVAALCCALDLSIGPANATTNLGAACGAPVWLISTPGAWPRLGTDRYPWYPQVRVFTPPAFNDWAPVMEAAAAALARVSRRNGRPSSGLLEA
ncbi:MAG: flagellar protein FlbA [Brevundimonas sp.]|nr:flagellar protein FlbA [Brevundimonas sp.]